MTEIETTTSAEVPAVPAPPEHTITALCQRSRDISLEKGWLNPDGTDPRPFYTVAALFHSELSEAFEEVRNNRPLKEIYYEVKIKEDGGQVSVTPHVTPEQLVELKKLDSKFGRGREFLDAKPCGIPIELADFVIRVCQWAGSAQAGEALARELARRELDYPEMPTIEEVIALTHGAVSKALNRANGEDVARQLGIVSYLADGLLRIFDFCRRVQLDLWAAIDEKEAYNRTRPIKHGGKKV